LLDDPVLLIVAAREHPRTSRVWGSGGWLPPQAREGLDWLTLCRCLGWGGTLCDQQSAAGQLAAQRQWVVLAIGDEAADEALLQAIEGWVREKGGTLILSLLPGHDSKAVERLAGAAARGRRFEGVALVSHPSFEPPARRSLRKPVEAFGLEPGPHARTLASIDSIAVAVSRPLGAGLVVSLGFHPSAARDADGAMTALLRRLMVSQSTRSVVWIDLEGVVALRMDDPGAAQNVHLGSWSYPELDEAAWRALARELSLRQARLSVCYCCGWVDDGDAKRGRLQVDGVAVDRVPGRVYPSPRVHYEDLAGHRPRTVHDYAGEYRGIQALRGAGLGDIELHGYTHQHPDSEAWAAASDRYVNVGWFRELGATESSAAERRAAEKHPIELGTAALDDHFSVRPTTLVCPGDKWTDAALEVALDCGLLAVSSYYLAIRDGDRFCWSTHVCAPYLDAPDAKWFDSGLPVIGYFHDKEPALEGPQWMGRLLDAWTLAGARRFIDFRELNGALARRVRVTSGEDGQLTICVEERGAPPLVRPMPMRVRGEGGRVPDAVCVSRAGSLEICPVLGDRHGVGRFFVRPDLHASASESPVPAPDSLAAACQPAPHDS